MRGQVGEGSSGHKAHGHVRVAGSPFALVVVCARQDGGGGRVVRGHATAPDLRRAAHTTSACCRERWARARMSGEGSSFAHTPCREDAEQVVDAAGFQERRVAPSGRFHRVARSRGKPRAEEERLLQQHPRKFCGGLPLGIRYRNVTDRTCHVPAQANGVEVQPTRDR